MRDRFRRPVILSTLPPAMKTRLLAMLVLCLAACYPASRGKIIEARVDKLDANSQDLARQLLAQRDRLRQESTALAGQLAALQGRLDKLDKASHTSDADVGVQMQAVREDLATLHGNVDQYQHRLDQLDQGIQQLSAATDEKFAAIKGPDALKKLEAAKEAAALQRPTDKKAYLALADAKAASGDTALAQTLYTEWLQKWPKDPLAARAHLALGTLDQSQNHHREALSEFGEVAKHFAKSAQAPAALLHSSESFAALNMADASKLALQAVVKDYPRSPEAKTARARLRKPAKKRSHR